MGWGWGSKGRLWGYWFGFIYLFLMLFLSEFIFIVLKFKDVKNRKIFFYIIFNFIIEVIN